jgi:hypothetical protein
VYSFCLISGSLMLWRTMHAFSGGLLPAPTVGSCRHNPGIFHFVTSVPWSVSNVPVHDDLDILFFFADCLGPLRILTRVPWTHLVQQLGRLLGWPRAGRVTWGPNRKQLDINRPVRAAHNEMAKPKNKLYLVQGFFLS